MTANNWSFLEHVTNHMCLPRMGDPKHPTLWPSEATALVPLNDDTMQVVGKCRRSIFFRYVTDSFKFYDKYSYYSQLVEEIKTKKLPPDKYMLWIWRAGELYEEHLINLAKESGTFVGEQIPIYILGSNVSGKIDLKAINPETGKYTNVEAKSVYGYGGNYVLGTPGERKKGQMGTPRDSNLMQIALYHWWTASASDTHEESRLVYGARDTGRFAEYLVKTELDEDTGIIKILYRGQAPNKTPWVTSPITINAILEGYAYIQNCVDSGQIPERDFELRYSDERLDQMHKDGALNKTDTAKYEKYLKYKSGESKRKIKPLEKGDWQCNLCSFKWICYDEDATPRELGC